jgi:hypothetical protein
MFCTSAFMSLCFIITQTLSCLYVENFFGKYSLCRVWGFHSGGYEEYHLLGWRRVVRWVSTDVLEEHIAPIFRVEEISSAKNQQASKIKAICSSELNGLHGIIFQKMIFFKYSLISVNFEYRCQRSPWIYAWVLLLILNRNRPSTVHLFFI